MGVDVLGIVPETLDACSSWEVTHVDLESVFIVKRWIVSDREALHELAELRNDTTEALGKLRSACSQHLINMEEGQGIANQRNCTSEEGQEAVCGVVKPGDWCQGNEEIHLGFPVVLVRGDGVEHLGGTLGMSQICNFLNSSILSGVVYHGWQIVLTELGPRKLPVSMLLGAECLVPKTVLRSSVVAKPHIIASSHILEGWGHVGVIHDEAVS